jgi:thymidylate synthase
MDHLTYRNASFATAAGLRDLFSSGAVLEVRGQSVRELRNRVMVLARPHERCLFLPRRGNDVVATLAETLWVIAGRNSIDWLSSYLPRAPQFSDDGRTWPGAYGPRLRNWNGIDQLAETIRLLREEPATRRAVMSLYDPDRDFVESKDIPCNNWLHWLIRNGKLHLTVGMRSNDVMWGFSGINSFEWSVLQDMMALWTGTEVGDATYLATSFHLYAHHEDRGRRIIESFKGVTCYDFGLSTPTFSTPFNEIDTVLSEWFVQEAQVRANPNRAIKPEQHFSDSFLSVALHLMRLHQGLKQGWSPARLTAELAQLPSCDLTAAAYELYSRQFPTMLETIPDPQIASFMAAYRAEHTISHGLT